MIKVTNGWMLTNADSITGGEPVYEFWTNNANQAGLPLVTLYTDGSGAIDNADFLTNKYYGFSDLQRRIAEYFDLP